MTLEGPVRAGDALLAALVRQDVMPHRSGQMLAVTGSRQPVAFLIHAGGATGAFGPDGSALALEEIERLRPGTLAEFTSKA